MPYECVDELAVRNALITTAVTSPAANRRDQMNFTIWSDGGEPDILKNFAIDGDGETVLFQMRCKRRVALAQHAQQLLDILRVDFNESIPTGDLL